MVLIAALRDLLFLINVHQMHNADSISGATVVCAWLERARHDLCASTMLIVHTIRYAKMLYAPAEVMLRGYRITE